LKSAISVPLKVGACHFVLLGSIQKITHRGGAEGAEQRVFDQEILRSLSTLRLCGEISLAALVAALRSGKSCELSFLVKRACILRRSENENSQIFAKTDSFISILLAHFLRKRESRDRTGNKK
jgi:hypothetical protein